MRKPLRLVPELEKYQNLVTFGTTLPGKLSILALFLLIRWSFSYSLAWVQALPIAIMALFEFRRDLKFLVVAILLAITQSDLISLAIARPFQYHGPIQAFLTTTQQEILQSIHPVLLNSAFLIVIASLLYLIQRICKRYRIASILAVYLAVLCLLLGLSEWIGGISRHYSNLALLFTLQFSVFVFAASYFHSYQLNVTANHSRFSKAFFLFQGAFTMFSSAGLPFIQNLNAFTAESPETTEQKHQISISRIKALKLLFWTRILLLAQDSVAYLFFSMPMRGLPESLKGSSFHLESPHYMGFGAYNLHAHSTLYSSVIVSLEHCLYLLQRATLAGPIIALIRLGGYYLPRHTVRPYLSKSVSEYFRRTHFFYWVFLVNTYFLPFLKRARNMTRAKKWVTFLVFLYTICYLSWVTDFIAHSHRMFVYGIKTYSVMVLSGIPYFLVLACFSFVFSSRPKKSSSSIVHWIRFAGIFLVIGFSKMFFTLNPSDTLGDRLQFFRDVLSLRF